MHMKFPHLHKHLERSVHICAWPRVCVAVLSWEESEQWPPSVCCKHRSMIAWVWALARLFVVVPWHGEVNQMRDFDGVSFGLRLVLKYGHEQFETDTAVLEDEQCGVELCGMSSGHPEQEQLCVAVLEDEQCGVELCGISSGHPEQGQLCVAVLEDEQCGLELCGISSGHPEQGQLCVAVLEDEQCGLELCGISSGHP